jgi:hypothetical protein
MTLKTSTRTRRGALTAATTVVLALAVSGAAVAAWRTTGSGSGTATAGSTVALTASASTTPASAALPGGAAVELTLVVSNPNPVPVRITGIALDPGRTVGVSGASGTCTTVPVGVSAVDLSTTLAAGASDVPLTVPGALTLGSSAPSGCQGATFTVPVVLTGQMP